MAINLDQLLSIFFDEADEHLAALEQGLLQMSNQPQNLELMNAVFRAAHSIKGGSGVFGFEAITRLTHALEQLLDKMRKGLLPATRDRIDLLLRAVDGLNKLIAAAREGGPESCELPGELISALETAADSKLTHAVSAPAESIAPSSSREYCVNFRPFPDFLSNGTDPQLLIRNLQKRSEIISISASLAAIPALDVIDPEICYVSWKIVVRTAETIDSIKSVFRFVEDVCLLEVTDHDPSESVISKIQLYHQLIAEYEQCHRELLNWASDRLPILTAGISEQSRLVNLV